MERMGKLPLDYSLLAVSSLGSLLRHADARSHCEEEAFWIYRQAEFTQTMMIARWLWVKITLPGDHWYQSMFLFCRVPFWDPFLTYSSFFLFPSMENFLKSASSTNPPTKSLSSRRRTALKRITFVGHQPP